jgi:glutathione-independent formaldehyde dehydrogenase
MRYNRQLRDLIVAGRATPSFLVSHELGDGWTKVLLRP